MKATTVQLGLCAVLPLAAAGSPKWDHNANVFRRQMIGNVSIGDVGNGNLNGNTVDSNNGNININLAANIVDSFNNNNINYYSVDPSHYYAKMCDTCNIVKVSKGNGTYTDQPCPVCPVETFHCPGYAIQKVTPHAANGTSGICNYQAPVCDSCKVVTPPPAPSMTTVEVHCPTCPVTSEVVSVPVTAHAVVASIASASGASAAKEAASSAVAEANAVTVTAPAGAASVAASTVVNVECTTCPAGKAATTVAQVPVTPVPGAPVPASNVSTPAGPAAPAFTGSATTLFTSALTIIVGLTASTLLFL